MADHTHGGHEYAESTDKMIVPMTVADYRLLMAMPDQIAGIAAMLRESIAVSRSELSAFQVKNEAEFRAVRADMTAGFHAVRADMRNGLDAADERISASEVRIDGIDRAYWHGTGKAAGSAAGLGIAGSFAWAIFTSWDKIKALFISPPHH